MPPNICHPAFETEKVFYLDKKDTIINDKGRRFRGNFRFAVNALFRLIYYICKKVEEFDNLFEHNIEGFGPKLN